MKPLSPVVRARLQAACDVVAPRQNSNPAVAARTIAQVDRGERDVVAFPVPRHLATTGADNG